MSREDRLSEVERQTDTLDTLGPCEEEYVVYSGGERSRKMGNEMASSVPSKSCCDFWQISLDALASDYRLLSIVERDFSFRWSKAQEFSCLGKPYGKRPSLSFTRTSPSDGQFHNWRLQRRFFKQREKRELSTYAVQREGY